MRATLALNGLIFIDVVTYKSIIQIFGIYKSHLYTAQKMKFSVKMSSVNVTKAAGFDHMH